MLSVKEPLRSISTERKRQRQRQHILKYYSDADAKMGIVPNLASASSVWRFRSVEIDLYGVLYQLMFCKWW